MDKAKLIKKYTQHRRLNKTFSDQNHIKVGHLKIKFTHIKLYYMKMSQKVTKINKLIVYYMKIH